MIEEERDALAGVEFLTSSRQEWSNTLLNGHITWHLTLHYLGRSSLDGCVCVCACARGRVYA